MVLTPMNRLARWFGVAVSLLALDVTGQEPPPRFAVPEPPRALVADAQADAALLVAAYTADDPLAAQGAALAAGWANWLLRKGVQSERLALVVGAKATQPALTAELDRLVALRPARLWIVVLARGSAGADGAWQLILAPAGAAGAAQPYAFAELLARARKAGPLVAVIDAPAAGGVQPLACAGDCAIVGQAVVSPATTGRLAWSALVALTGPGDRNADGKIEVGEVEQSVRASGLQLVPVEPVADATKRAGVVLARVPVMPAPSAGPPPPPPPDEGGDAKKPPPPPGTGGSATVTTTKRDSANATGGAKGGSPKDKTDPDLDKKIGDSLGSGGLGLSGTGKGGGGSGEGTIGLGNLGTIGKGAGGGSGSGYGSGAGGLAGRGPARKKPTPVERFPTLEAPDRAEVGQTFALQVSLTELKVVQDVKVQQGAATAEGKLQMELDDTPGPW